MMTLVQKLMALKSVSLFGELDDADLALIAGVATERAFEPGERFCAAGRCLQRLTIVLEGCIETDEGQCMPPILGAASLLFDAPVAHPLRASAKAGARCLVVAKAHFFTIIYQCPAVLLGLMDNERFETAPVGEDGAPS